MIRRGDINLISRNRSSVVIIDDSADNLHLLSELLSGEGYLVRPFINPKEALKALLKGAPDLILLDIDMPVMDGFEVCREIQGNSNLKDVPVIFISAATDVESKVRGFGLGGVDFVSRPFFSDEVLARIETHLELRRQRKMLEEEVARRQQAESELRKINDELESRVEQRTLKLRKARDEVARLKAQVELDNAYLREEIDQSHNYGDIIGHSPAIKKTLMEVSQVAKTNSTVLILGESGTGKELIARAVHSLSGRKARPLVKVCCASLPPTLIESELFGHEKGAFSGADKARQGRFELANKGTLFLDEVGELPMDLQAKLLRVLQDGEFERVGGNKVIKTDIRFIAATNRDLQEMVSKGEFREDLWFRLNVFPIRVPPLRQRPEDIVPLVTAFVDNCTKQMGKKIDVIPVDIMDRFVKYQWPGNVRELQHVIERAVIMTPGNKLKLLDPLEPSSRTLEVGNTVLRPLAEMEKEHITNVLEAAYWKIEGAGGAADILGLNPSTLRFRMKKLGIFRPNTARNN